MELWLCIVVFILSMGIVVMAGKLVLFKRAVKEIGMQLKEKLETETNTLIVSPSADPSICMLANILNQELIRLGEERHRYQQGDRELKHAVTGISHDLRTPLTAICGYLDLLEQEQQPEQIYRYLRIIRERTELMERLTEELFSYALIAAGEELKKEPVTLNHVLEESLAAFYADLCARGITPSVKMTEKKIVRELDHAALLRVYANLLHNAIKYSDGDLEITLGEDGVTSFENTAAALSGVEVGRLFDRFYTVETARRSTGLGLSIAKALVGEMGGRISASYDGMRLRIIVSFS